MTRTLDRKDPKEGAKGKARGFGRLPWPLVLLAALPVAAAAWYLILEAPGQVPLHPGAKPTFPAAARFLEEVCAWCGQNPLGVLLIAGGLMVGGYLLPMDPARYYIAVAILVTLALGFTWYTISSPVEDVLRSVEESLPRR